MLHLLDGYYSILRCGTKPWQDHYLLSAKGDNFRLAALSDAYETGVFYGGPLTVASPSLSTKAPASTYFVLKKMNTARDIVRGMIEPDHQNCEGFSNALCFAKDEGFFRIFDRERISELAV